MGARPYSPTHGRFLAVDPIEGGCANDYTYTDGDPLNAGDIHGTGCTPWEYFAAAIGIEASFAPAEAIELGIHFGGSGPFSGKALYGNTLRFLGVAAKAVGIIAASVVIYNIAQRCGPDGEGIELAPAPSWPV